MSITVQQGATVNRNKITITSSNPNLYINSIHGWTTEQAVVNGPHTFGREVIPYETLDLKTLTYTSDIDSQFSPPCSTLVDHLQLQYSTAAVPAGSFFQQTVGSYTTFVTATPEVQEYNGQYGILLTPKVSLASQTTTFTENTTSSIVALLRMTPPNDSNNPGCVWNVTDKQGNNITSQFSVTNDFTSFTSTLTKNNGQPFLVSESGTYTCTLHDYLGYTASDNTTLNITPHTPTAGSSSGNNHTTLTINTSQASSDTLELDFSTCCIGVSSSPIGQNILLPFPTKRNNGSAIYYYSKLQVNLFAGDNYTLIKSFPVEFKLIQGITYSIDTGYSNETGANKWRIVSGGVDGDYNYVDTIPASDIHNSINEIVYPLVGGVNYKITITAPGTTKYNSIFLGQPDYPFYPSIDFNIPNLGNINYQTSTVLFELFEKTISSTPVLSVKIQPGPQVEPWRIIQYLSTTSTGGTLGSSYPVNPSFMWYPLESGVIYTFKISVYQNQLGPVFNSPSLVCIGDPITYFKPPPSINNRSTNIITVNDGQENSGVLQVTGLSYGSAQSITWTVNTGSGPETIGQFNTSYSITNKLSSNFVSILIRNTVKNAFISGDSGTYVCTVSDSYGTSTTTFIITVIPVAPVFVGTMTSQGGSLIGTGTISKFIAPPLSQGSSPITYLWKFGKQGTDTILPIGNSTNQCLVTLTPDCIGKYYVSAQNSVGSSEELLFEITEILDYPVYNVNPNQNLLLGSPFCLTNKQPASAKVYEYKWFLNGTQIIGATGPTYFIQSGTYNHAGVYYSIAVNKLGAIVSKPSYVSFFTSRNSGLGAIETYKSGSGYSIPPYLSLAGSGFDGSIDKGTLDCMYIQKINIVAGNTLFSSPPIITARDYPNCKLVPILKNIPTEWYINKIPLPTALIGKTVYEPISVTISGEGSGAYVIPITQSATANSSPNSGSVVAIFNWNTGNNHSEVNVVYNHSLGPTTIDNPASVLSGGTWTSGWDTTRGAVYVSPENIGDNELCSEVLNSTKVRICLAVNPMITHILGVKVIPTDKTGFGCRAKLDLVDVGGNIYKGIHFSPSLETCKFFEPHITITAPGRGYSNQPTFQIIIIDYSDYDQNGTLTPINPFYIGQYMDADSVYNIYQTLMDAKQNAFWNWCWAFYDAYFALAQTFRDYKNNGFRWLSTDIPDTSIMTDYENIQNTMDGFNSVDDISSVSSSYDCINRYKTLFSKQSPPSFVDLAIFNNYNDANTKLAVFKSATDDYSNTFAKLTDFNSSHPHGPPVRTEKQLNSSPLVYPCWYYSDFKGDLNSAGLSNPFVIGVRTNFDLPSDGYVDLLGSKTNVGGLESDRDKAYGVNGQGQAAYWDGGVGLLSACAALSSRYLTGAFSGLVLSSNQAPGTVIASGLLSGNSAAVSESTRLAAIASEEGYFETSNALFISPSLRVAQSQAATALVAAEQSLIRASNLTSTAQAEYVLAQALRSADVQTVVEITNSLSCYGSISTSSTITELESYFKNVLGGVEADLFKQLQSALVGLQKPAQSIVSLTQSLENFQSITKLGSIYTDADGQVRYFVKTSEGLEGFDGVKAVFEAKIEQAKLEANAAWDAFSDAYDRAFPVVTNKILNMSLSMTDPAASGVLRDSMIELRTFYPKGVFNASTEAGLEFRSITLDALGKSKLPLIAGENTIAELNTGDNVLLKNFTNAVGLAEDALSPSWTVNVTQLRTALTIAQKSLATSTTSASEAAAEYSRRLAITGALEEEVAGARDAVSLAQAAITTARTAQLTGARNLANAGGRAAEALLLNGAERAGIQAAAASGQMVGAQYALRLVGGFLNVVGYAVAAFLAALQIANLVDGGASFAPDVSMAAWINGGILPLPPGSVLISPGSVITSLVVVNPGSGYFPDTTTCTVNTGGIIYNDPNFMGTSVTQPTVPYKVNVPVDKSVYSYQLTNIGILSQGTGFFKTPVIDIAAPGYDNSIATSVTMSCSRLGPITHTSNDYFTSPPPVLIDAGSDPSNPAFAVARLSSTPATGVVTGLQYVNPGVAEYWLPLIAPDVSLNMINTWFTVTISPPASGNQATATITKVAYLLWPFPGTPSGYRFKIRITEIQLTYGGSGYTSLPSVSIHGSPAGISAGVSVITPAIIYSEMLFPIQDIPIIDNGLGYSSIPNVKIINTTTCTTVGTTVGSTGAFSNIYPKIRSPGYNYVSADTQPTVSNYFIQSCSVTGGGTGYISPSSIGISSPNSTMNDMIKYSTITSESAKGIELAITNGGYYEIESLSASANAVDFAGINIVVEPDPLDTIADWQTYATPVINGSIVGCESGVGIAVYGPPYTQLETKIDGMYPRNGWECTVESVDGNGSGANIFVLPTQSHYSSKLNAFIIDEYTIINGGSGYTSSPKVTISLIYRGLEIGKAVFYARIGGPLASVKLVNSPSGFDLTPTVTVSSYGQRSNYIKPIVAFSKFTELTDAGKLTNVYISNQYNGFTGPPSIVVSNPPPHGLTPTITPNMSLFYLRFFIVTGGSGYNYPPRVIISNSTGAGAIANATITSGSVTNVSFATYGSGYVGQCTVTFVPHPLDNPANIIAATATCTVTFSTIVTAPRVVAIPYDGNGSGAKFNVSVNNGVYLTGTQGGDGNIYGTMEVPNTVHGISSGSYGKQQITSLIFQPPEICYEIGDYAFANCPNLQTVYIPSSIQRIGDGAFFGCTGLSTVVFEGLTGPYMGKDSFASTSSALSFYIQADSRNIIHYDGYTGWTDISRMFGIELRNIDFDIMSTKPQNTLGITPLKNSLVQIPELSESTFSVACDTDGNVYWNNNNLNIIQKIDLDGNQTVFSNELYTVKSLTIASDNNMYVVTSDNDNIYQIPLSDSTMWTQVCSIPSGYLIASDNHNNVYVATSNPYGIYTFQITGESQYSPSVYASFSNNVKIGGMVGGFFGSLIAGVTITLPLAGSVLSYYGPNKAHNVTYGLDKPTGITLDNAGNIYVGSSNKDTLNGVVLITTDGLNIYSHATGFYTQGGLAFSPKGNIFFSDNSNLCSLPASVADIPANVMSALSSHDYNVISSVIKPGDQYTLTPADILAINSTLPEGSSVALPTNNDITYVAPNTDGSIELTPPEQPDGTDVQELTYASSFKPGVPTTITIGSYAPCVITYNATSPPTLTIQNNGSNSSMPYTSDTNTNPPATSPFDISPGQEFSFDVNSLGITLYSIGLTVFTVSRSNAAFIPGVRGVPPAVCKPKKQGIDYSLYLSSNVQNSEYLSYKEKPLDASEWIRRKRMLSSVKFGSC